MPFSSLIAWNENLKESWDRPDDRAPIPHAERLTLAALAENGGVDFAAASSRLAARGITGFNADTIVQTIAGQAKLPAREVYDIILAGQTGAAAHTDGRLGGGPGWKTLVQLCTDEGIALEAAHARLTARGIRFDDTQTLREIATNNEVKPYALVELIRAGSASR